MCKGFFFNSNVIEHNRVGEGCLVSHSLQFRSGGPPGSEHIPLPVRGGFNKAVIAVPVTRQANIAFLGLSLERKILPVIYCEARLLKLLLQKSCETKNFTQRSLFLVQVFTCVKP